MTGQKSESVRKPDSVNSGRINCAIRRVLMGGAGDSMQIDRDSGFTLAHQRAVIPRFDQRSMRTVPGIVP